MLGAVPRGSRPRVVTTVLILGGYGGFGVRLSRRLASAGHRVLVAGRDLRRAQALCTAIPGCEPLHADRKGDIAALLAEHRPALLIDAAGPFQDGDLRVPAACIAAGIAYLDLADARVFVTTIATLDDAAKRAEVAVLSGASSVPALSGAVVRALAHGIDRATAIEIAISASNRAAAGASVATAILSYVGRPIALRRAGRWTARPGWQELRRERFALADGTVIYDRLVALADVPDLALLPERVAGRPAVTFRAGTELAVQNLILWLASWPVRWHWLASLAPFARLLLPLQRLTARLGSDRSAMSVRLFGVGGGARIERCWTLIADDGDGPEIPTLAAAILADRILRGEIAPGARDAGTALDLADFAPAFGGLAIRHETTTHSLPPPLYARVMGQRFDALAPEVAAIHDVLRDGGARGRATVTGGGNPLARMIARIMRFPPPGEHELHVAIAERDGVERWTRDFGGHRFTSELSERGERLVERFGPLRFTFDLPSDGTGLRMAMRGWSCLGVPLPLALAPRSDAREWAEDGRFHFEVPIALPLVGPVVHYTGWLVPIGDEAAPR